LLDPDECSLDRLGPGRPQSRSNFPNNPSGLLKLLRGLVGVAAVTGFAGAGFGCVKESVRKANTLRITNPLQAFFIPFCLLVQVFC